MFKLHAPDIRLHIANDALPGGLDAWGDGDLEVVVDGAISLGEFFDITERMASISDTTTKMAEVRGTLRDFGKRIKEWTIEGWEAGGDGYMNLPYPLALAIFMAWQGATQVDPTSSGAPVNGSLPPARLETTAA